MKKIKLQGYTYKNKYVLVDDEDFILLNNIRWYAVKSERTFYCYAKINGKPIQMHTFLVNPPKGFEVDHKDQNGLNNCKINLRVATKSQNQANRKTKGKCGYKGISPHRLRFMAKIKIGQKQVYLGLFKTPQEAAQAYDEAAVKQHGEFALTNKMMGLLN